MGDQTKTCHQSMKLLTVELRCVVCPNYLIEVHAITPSGSRVAVSFHTYLFIISFITTFLTFSLSYYLGYYIILISFAIHLVNFSMAIWTNPRL